MLGNSAGGEGSLFSYAVMGMALRFPSSWDLYLPRLSCRRSWVQMRRLGPWMVIRQLTQVALKRRRDRKTLKFQGRQIY